MVASYLGEFCRFKVRGGTQSPSSARSLFTSIMFGSSGDLQACPQRIRCSLGSDCHEQCWTNLADVGTLKTICRPDRTWKSAPQQDDVPPVVYIQLYAPFVCQNQIMTSGRLWIECGLHRAPMHRSWSIQTIFYGDNNRNKLGNLPNCFDHLQQLLHQLSI